MSNFYEIPSHNFSFLEAHIEKLNKTATKLGCVPTEMFVMFPFSKNIGTADEPKFIEFLKVSVDGKSPVLDGWTFIGKREPIEGSTSVLTKTAPNSVVPVEFSDDHALKCDHCHKKNSRRIFTYLVQKEEQTLEVGKTCLKDFIGHGDPEKLAAYAESLFDINSYAQSLIDPDYMGGGRVVLTADLEYMVTLAVAQIRQHGFVSGKLASEEMIIATSSYVHDHLFPPMFSKLNEHTISFNEQDEKNAVAAIAFLKNHPKAGVEEFWTNLSKIVSLDYAPGKMLGYICAGVNFYLKSLVVSSGDFDQAPIAEAGQKVEVSGEVLSAFAYDTAFGTKHIFTVKTDSNKLIKMFTCSGWNVEKGSRVCIKGKVGSFEVESFARSPFKGKFVTTMAPRAKIVLA